MITLIELLWITGILQSCNNETIMVRKLQAGIGLSVSNIMNDWLIGKTRDEEQIQDDIDKYQMMECRILATASIKRLQDESF